MNRPGSTVVATLTNPTSLNSGLNAFTAPSATTLAAETVYWVSVNEGVASNRAALRFTASTAQTGEPGWRIGNSYLFRSDEANAWGPVAGAMSMAVNGAAVLVTNNAPVFSDDTLTRSVAENTASGQNVGAAVTASDADSGDTLTYTLDGADAASFSIVADTGQIRTAAALDFEAKSSYSVTVRASDGTASDTVAVTINVTDVAEAPATPAAPMVSATAGSNTSVDVSWTKPGLNGGPEITGYEVGYRQGTNGSWTAHTHGGTATSASIGGLMAGSPYQVRVRALNGETPSAWSAPGSGSTSTPVNNAPVFSPDTLTRSVAENTGSGQNVGAAVTATDDDPGDTLTYTLEGADAASFSIVSATGQIRTGAALDFETKSAYSVTVRASDGTASDTASVTINVTDVAEAPATPAAPMVSATSGSNASLDVTWAKPGLNGGPDITGYEVGYRQGMSGNWTPHTHSGTTTNTAISGLIEDTAYQVRVRALNGETPSAWSAPGSGSTSRSDNNAPVFSDRTLTRSVAENTPPGQNVGAAVTATDADPGDTLTYTLEGADASSFSIVSATGQIRTAATLDFEAKSAYSVTVRASDGTASDTAAVTINVTDVAEAPATPTAPRVSATSGSNTSIDVTWAKPGLNGGPDITGYEVGYRQGSSGNWTPHAHSGTTTRATLTGLSEGTSYQARVRALNGETPSAWSAPGSGRTRSASDAVAVNGDLRLVDGPTENEGRLEIFTAGTLPRTNMDLQWGTVCDDRFFDTDNVAAAVACRILGYADGGEGVLSPHLSVERQRRGHADLAGRPGLFGERTFPPDERTGVALGLFPHRHRHAQLQPQRGCGGTVCGGHAASRTRIGGRSPCRRRWKPAGR